MNVEESSIEEKLRQVLDPEVGLNIVDLGLLNQIRIDDRDIEIEMTLTSPVCPVGPLILEEVEATVQAEWPDHEVILSLVFDPPWTPQRISPEGRKTLQL